jgi:hypothetical protein
VTTLRAAIQYIYGLQNLLDEIQTGTLDLAAYQLTEAELRPPPNKPSAPQLKPLKKGGRQNGGTSVRKPAQRRKPVQRPPPHAASAPAGGGGGLRSGPVTLAMKASGLPPPAHRKSEKRPSPPMAAVASSAPEPAARYVLPLQPRDASHVLRRDYAPAGHPRQPSAGLPVGKAAAAPTAPGVTSSLSPNLLSLRPLPVSALFPGSTMQQQQPLLPSLQTLRHPRTTAGGGEGEKAMLNAEEVHNSGSSSSGSSTAFYCTTAGMYKRTFQIFFDRHCSFLQIK